MRALFINLFTGGFYSDNVGHVAENCKMCPNGSFVAYDKAPGTRAQDCKSCPHGKLYYEIALCSFIIHYIYGYVRLNMERAYVTRLRCSACQIQIPTGANDPI